MNDERNFDRLLDIQEKSIIAWERTTDKLEELTKENREIKQFILFIQKHYLRNKDNIFCPKRDNIIPYFSIRCTDLT